MPKVWGRISRAKQKIKGLPFRQPGPEDRDARLAVVLQVLYLIFNEGYTATSGTICTAPTWPVRRSG